MKPRTSSFTLVRRKSSASAREPTAGAHGWGLIKEREREPPPATDDEDATQATTQEGDHAGRRRGGVIRQAQPTAQHHQISAYSINAYLVLAPTLAAQLRRGAEPAPLSALPAALELDAATAAQLPRLARAGGGASSPTTKRSRPPAGASSMRARSKPARRPPPPDADSDFEGCEAAAPAATGEVVVLDDDDDSD